MFLAIVRFYLELTIMAIAIVSLKEEGGFITRNVQFVLYTAIKVHAHL